MKTVKNEKGEVVKAGGIVVKEEDGKKYVLLLYRKYHNDWSFPKGHVEPDDSIEETTIKEIKEETGLDVEIVKELKLNRYWNTKSEEENVCHMFLLSPVSGELKPEYEGDDLIWIPLEDVTKKLHIQNLIDYFESVKGDL